MRTWICCVCTHVYNVCECELIANCEYTMRRRKTRIHSSIFKHSALRFRGSIFLFCCMGCYRHCQIRENGHFNTLIYRARVYEYASMPHGMIERLLSCLAVIIMCATKVYKIEFNIFFSSQPAFVPHIIFTHPNDIVYLYACVYVYIIQID